MRPIYLDYNATTPLRPEVIDGMGEALRVTGNASSIHGFGRAARKMVEDARADIAALAGVRPAQVIFNSGATEGNNTILSGYTGKNVLISAIEHPSIFEAADKADRLPVTKDGTVDLDKLEVVLESSKTDLLCVQLVNSETGAIQPLQDITRQARARGTRVHCDAVQAAGRIGIDFKALDVDTLTLSAHKFGGPQGVGALIFRDGLQLPKLLKGGGQERRQRAGTENIAAIHGFGIAARLAAQTITAYQSHCGALRTRLENGLRALPHDLVLVSENAPRVANTVNVIARGVSAETQLMGMDLEGIAVSSGSACSSGTFKPSHVLTAMGYTDEDARSALRFSFGWATTEADIDAALAAYTRLLARVKK